MDTASLLRSHLARYPAMQPADGYKLLHQAVLGSEHAVRDSAAAQAWMEREWATMAEGPDEPLVDTLGTPGRFARVHLRPWREAGGAPDVLVRAFVATANGAGTDTGAFTCALDRMIAQDAAGAIPWTPRAVRALVDTARAAGYPAMHHSAAYEASARPAYRVVSLDLVPGLMASLSSSRRP